MANTAKPFPKLPEQGEDEEETPDDPVNDRDPDGGDGSEPDFIAVVIQPPMFFGETRLLFDLWCLNIFDIQLWGWLNPMGFNGELPIPVSWLQKPMESI